MARLQARHGERGGNNGAKVQALFNKMYAMYEPAGEDEEGAVNVSVTEDMSRDDVLQRVLETIAKM